MAAAGDIQELCEEATCPICLDYFRDPVTTAECGHNFCQGCLTQSWGENDDGALDVSCPQCRETAQRKSLIPNRAMKNMVEIVKKLSLGWQRRTTGEERVCEKHQEPLKLFCRDHEVPICVVCDKAKDHENHKVIPQEEAFQEYKDLELSHQDQVCSRMKILRAEREKILTYKGEAEKESQDLLNQTEEERQKTMVEFQLMHQFLEEKKKIILAQIAEVEKEVARRRDEHLARLFRELSSLEKLIQEMEEKSQQPASEFLQIRFDLRNSIKDIRKTLQRYEKETFENPVAFPLELSSRIREFSYKKPLLEGLMKMFEAANVTLDPDTAHPYLILSEDHKSMRCGDKPQDLPNNPERFKINICVLGRQGFISGRHFWEVTVGRREGDWLVGVARKSVKRKDWCSFGPENNIWAVGMMKDFYHFSSYHAPKILSSEHQRIRVTVNCDERQVSFSDADSGVNLHTYSGASLCRETLFPFYLNGKGHLRISP